MRPHISFTGTVIDDPKIILPQKVGAKPFLAFTVESPDSYNPFPNRVKVVVYDKDLEAVKSRLPKGSIVAVDGDASVEAYMSTRTNKPTGAIKCFAKSFEVFGGSVDDPAPQRPSRPTQQNLPNASAPAAPEDDDVPF